MRSIRVLTAVTMLAMCPSLATIARCEPRDRAAAEALFQAGRDAAQRGDYGAACDKFRESNRLDPAIGTQFNLADCSEHIGKLATAWELFKEVAQRLPPNDDRVPIANGRASAIEPRLPRMALTAPSDASPNLVVLRDGVEFGAASFDLFLPADPGEHLIVVRAAGRTDNEIKVVLAPGEQKRIALTLGSPIAEAPSPPPSVDTSATAASRTRTTGYFVAGIGALGLGTSLVTGAMALTAKHTVDDHCNANPNKVCDTEDAYAAASRGKALATVSTVAFVVGAVGVGVGAYLILARGGSKTAAVAASAGPDGGFVGMVGRF